MFLSLTPCLRTHPRNQGGYLRVCSAHGTPICTFPNRDLKTCPEASGSRHIRNHQIFCNSYNQGSSYYKHTLHARPAEFFTQHIYNLCITDAVPRRVASEVLISAQAFGISYSGNMRNYLPFMLILPFSSTSLSTYRVTLRMLAESRTVFPRVTQSTVGLNRRKNFPTLEWLPNPTSVEIDFSDQPAEDEEWAADVTTCFRLTHSHDPWW